MDWALMIPIVAIIMGISIPITAIKLKHKEKLEQMRLAAGGNHDSARAQQQDARIELLEDRIAVLERIVTDKGYDVASQIEALRHDHRIDADLADLRRTEQSGRS